MPREIQVKFASENCCKITQFSAKLHNFLQMPKEIILLFTGYCTNMAFHAKSVNMTHNLEVPGSSPGWSTLTPQDCSWGFLVPKAFVFNDIRDVK